MTSRETVTNKALSGAELKQIIRADFERLLENESMLVEYVAYGRVSYDVTLRLHLDNFMHPESIISASSKPAATNEVAENPALAALESGPPLPASSPENMVSASRRDRHITSPNVERVRAGIPISVAVRQHDGTVTTEHVQYPPDPTLGEGEVNDVDVTEETKADWGLLNRPQDIKS